MRSNCPGDKLESVFRTISEKNRTPHKVRWIPPSRCDGVAMMLAVSVVAATSHQQRLAVRTLTAPPAAGYIVRTAISLLAESAEDGGGDTVARVVRDGGEDTVARVV